MRTGLTTRPNEWDPPRAGRDHPHPLHRVGVRRHVAASGQPARGGLPRHRQDPRLHHGIHGRVNVASLQGSILGVPRGLQLGRGIQADGRRGDQHESRNALGRDRGHAQRYISPNELPTRTRARDPAHPLCSALRGMRGLDRALLRQSRGDPSQWLGSHWRRGAEAARPTSSDLQRQRAAGLWGPTCAALVVWQRHAVDDCAPDRSPG